MCVCESKVCGYAFSVWVCMVLEYTLCKRWVCVLFVGIVLCMYVGLCAWACDLLAWIIVCVGVVGVVVSYCELALCVALVFKLCVVSL